MKFLIVFSILFLSACDKLPKPPAIWQCQYNGEPRAFYCVNTDTKEKMKIDANDESMRAAQCVSADDFKKGEQYIADLKQAARERCK